MGINEHGGCDDCDGTVADLIRQRDEARRLAERYYREVLEYEKVAMPSRSYVRRLPWEE